MFASQSEVNQLRYATRGQRGQRWSTLLPPVAGAGSQVQQGKVCGVHFSQFTGPTAGRALHASSSLARGGRQQAASSVFVYPWLWAAFRATFPLSEQSHGSAISGVQGLTPQSSGAPTACHLAPATGTVYIFCIAGLAACRCRPLSSNVRPRKNHLGEFRSLEQP